jgi:hypothetical protein
MMMMMMMMAMVLRSVSVPLPLLGQGGRLLQGSLAQSAAAG